MSEELDERLRRALASEDVDEIVEVGCDLSDADREEDALTCFRRAVALGDDLVWFNIGNTLDSLRRPLEAIDAYERAAAAGETDAWLNLGIVLELEGDLVGAMAAYRSAWSAGGQAQGYVNLALLQREQGLLEDAEATMTQAADRGHLPAVAHLAVWRWQHTLDPTLEPELRAGAGVDGEARAALADLLATTDRAGEARTELELGAKLGQDECWLPLGNLLSEGDPAAAEDAYRAGIAVGDTYCHHNLAMLLLEQGDDAGAEAQLIAGAAAGDELAQQVWQELHRED